MNASFHDGDPGYYWAAEAAEVAVIAERISERVNAKVTKARPFLLG